MKYLIMIVAMFVSIQAIAVDMGYMKRYVRDGLVLMVPTDWRVIGKHEFSEIDSGEDSSVYVFSSEEPKTGDPLLNTYFDVSYFKPAKKHSKSLLKNAERLSKYLVKGRNDVVMTHPPREKKSEHFEYAEVEFEREYKDRKFGEIYVLFKHRDLIYMATSNYELYKVGDDWVDTGEQRQLLKGLFDLVSVQ